MDKSEQSLFYQFSDQLRLGNLSFGDTIWSSADATTDTATWKQPIGLNTNKIAFSNHNSSVRNNNNNNNNFVNTNNSIAANKTFFSNNNSANSFNKAVTKPAMGIYNNNYRRNNNNINTNDFGVGKKKSVHGVNGNNNRSENNSNNNSNSGVDKRFKTLPPAEALPRNEAVGGYIFVCNNDTMQENLKRELFGLPPRYRDSVRSIKPGLPLFLYNYSTHQLHGIFEAASFGGTNIDPSAWEDKKSHGESRFPAQVKVVTRKICDPLEEDSFRPILHHYDGPKFRLELSVPEALALLDIFAENNA